MVPDAYANAIRLMHALSRLFFRRVEVTGTEAVPDGGGGIVVAWHPNGVVDPVLIATSCPRPIVFGARDGLFRMPLVGGLLRAVRAVPLYRASDATGGDEAARRDRNRSSLDALAGVVAGGALSALFPEGASHDDPHTAPLKVGAARLYYRAIELAPADAPLPVVLPVGLYYDDKSTFRSRALVSFHPPLPLPDRLQRLPTDADEASRRAQVAALTAEIERALHEVVHPTESWQLHHAMHRTRTLLRAERARRAGARSEPVDMQERVLGFERVWRGYLARRQDDPLATEALLARVLAYDAELRELGLRDDELDRGGRLLSPWLPVLFVAQAVLVYVLLPPLLLAGYVINAVPYLLLRALARLGKTRKDEASIKMLGALVLFPVTWLLTAWLAAVGVVDLHLYFAAVPDAPWTAASFALALGVGGGFVAMQYKELSERTLRALRVRLTRSRRAAAIERLRATRAELHDAIEAMAAGLALPGRLEPDGRVSR